jgi:hypothetical protein
MAITLTWLDPLTARVDTQHRWVLRVRGKQAAVSRAQEEMRRHGLVCTEQLWQTDRLTWEGQSLFIPRDSWTARGGQVKELFYQLRHVTQEWGGVVVSFALVTTSGLQAIADLQWCRAHEAAPAIARSIGSGLSRTGTGLVNAIEGAGSTIEAVGRAADAVGTGAAAAGAAAQRFPITATTVAAAAAVAYVAWRAGWLA